VIEGRTVLAVIPARSGSKRLPGKNIRDFNGKPLYLWAVEQAATSRYIDFTKLSLDADRPAELCADDASCEDVMRYHLAQYPHDWIVLLQPTSPLRTVEDIDACIERAQMGVGCISIAFSTRKTNGAVYVASADYLSKHDFIYDGLMKYVMPNERSLDINTEEDFLACLQSDCAPGRKG